MARKYRILWDCNLFFRMFRRCALRVSIFDDTSILLSPALALPTRCRSRGNWVGTEGTCQLPLSPPEISGWTFDRVIQHPCFPEHFLQIYIVRLGRELCIVPCEVAYSADVQNKKNGQGTAHPEERAKALPGVMYSKPVHSGSTQGLEAYFLCWSPEPPSEPHQHLDAHKESQTCFFCLS